VSSVEFAAVIVTASDRLYAHPNQFPVSDTMGLLSVDYRTDRFQGWTLVNLGVLDRYRVKVR
jgi:hypothetical protein